MQKRKLGNSNLGPSPRGALSPPSAARYSLAWIEQVQCPLTARRAQPSLSGSETVRRWAAAW
jgi:hypothetical protein